MPDETKIINNHSTLGTSTIQNCWPYDRTFSIPETKFIYVDKQTNLKIMGDFEIYLDNMGNLRIIKNGELLQTFYK